VNVNAQIGGNRTKQQENVNENGIEIEAAGVSVESGSRWMVLDCLS